MVTNDEAIKSLNTLRESINGVFDYNCRNQCTALDKAIKALEQQSTLDKIRAEIKGLSPEPTIYDIVDRNQKKDAVWETVNDVLQIIDKYKAESEE